jgi:hypothetical protein
MTINSNLLKSYMETFFGYGDLRAPYWYIGMEEGGESSEISQRLNAWDALGRRELEDLLDFHTKARIGQEFFGKHAKRQATWWQLIRMTLAAEGRPLENEEVRSYQAERLGRTTERPRCWNCTRCRRERVRIGLTGRFAIYRSSRIEKHMSGAVDP